MNGAEFFGKTLKVSWAKPKKVARLHGKKAVWNTEEYLQTLATQNAAENN